MVEEVIWSAEAAEQFNKVIKYLHENWSDHEVENFLSATSRTLEYIVERPRMFRQTERRNVYEALITVHNLLIYHVSGNKIHIVTIWDTRQDPRKKKYKTR